MTLILAPTPGIATEMRDSSRMHLLLDSQAAWVAGRLASTPVDSDVDGRQDTEASATAEVSMFGPNLKPW